MELINLTNYNRIGKIMQRKPHTLTLLASILLSLPSLTVASPSIFADLPLIYQNKKTTALSHDVKPNVALVIDNNEEMGNITQPPVTGIMCHRYHYGSYGWQPFHSTGVWWTQFDSSDEMERVLQEEEQKYGPRFNGKCRPELCNDVYRHFREDCKPGGRTAMRTVQLVLKELIQKYRDKMRFAVLPTSNFGTGTQIVSQLKTQLGQWGMPHLNVINSGQYQYSKNAFKLDAFSEQALKIPSKYYDGTSAGELNQLLHNIDLLRPILLDQKFDGKSSLMDALPRIAKDVVMKGQQYRCQKSFLVILSNGHQFDRSFYLSYFKTYDLKDILPSVDGGSGLNNVPQSWWDSDFELKTPSHIKPDAIWDGYFDLGRLGGPLGRLYSNFSDKYFHKVCQGKYGCRLKEEDYPIAPTDSLLAYYTQRLATKNFGPYIYKDDYYQSCMKVQEERNTMGSIYKVYYSFPRPIGSSAQPAVNSPDFFCTGKLGVLTTRERREKDNAGEAWDAINPQTGRPYTQTAETFTIGMGLQHQIPSGIPNRLLDKDSTGILYYAATPVGKHDPVSNPDGRFYDIKNSYDELLTSFDDIFRKIYESSTAVSIIDTVAATVGLSSTSEGDTSFTAKVDTGSWSSQICIHDRGEDPSSCAVQPNYANRQLVLNDGTNSYLHSADLTVNGLNNAAFRIKDHRSDPTIDTNLDPEKNNNKTEWRDGLLTWLARAKDDDAIKTAISNSWFVLDYRNRTDVANFGNSRNIGDILNNPLISIGDQLEDMRHQKYLITSANDGMVYVFGATKDKAKPYDLKFNYMPLNMQRQSNDNSDLAQHYFQDLTDNQYGQFTTKPHHYLLNGGMVVQQTDDRGDGVKQTFMVSTMGQGGRGAFAINIGGKDILSQQNIGVDNMSSPDWYKDLQLFRTPAGNNNKFGYTVGTPAVARIRVNYGNSRADVNSYKHNIVAAAFISNGYNYSDTLATDTARKESAESALYVYNALGADVGTDGYKPLGNKGDLIQKIVAEGGRGGLSSPFAFDINGDNVADIVYAGDYGGNLFRFDIRDPDPSKWRGVKIFTANRPITTAPLVLKADQNGSGSQKLVVVFGTGSDLYDQDLDNLDQQAIYGIYDDYNVTDSTAQVSKQDLLPQTISVNGQYRSISKNKFDPVRYKGWYIDLDPTDGERVVSNFSRLLTTGIIPTRIYEVKKGVISAKKQDPCSSEIFTQDVSAKTRMMQFSLRTGSGLSENDPHIVFDKDSPLSIVSKEGLVGFDILSEAINNIGGTGNWLPLGSTPPSPDHCMDKLPVVGTTEGLIDKSDIKNVLCAPITFKVLSWREIKESFNL